MSVSRGGAQGRAARGEPPSPRGLAPAGCPGVEGQLSLEQPGAPLGWLGGTRTWPIPVLPPPRRSRWLHRRARQIPPLPRVSGADNTCLYPHGPRSFMEMGLTGLPLGGTLSAPCPRMLRTHDGLQGPRTRHEGRDCGGLPGALPRHACGGAGGGS